MSRKNAVAVPAAKPPRFDLASYYAAETIDVTITSPVDGTVDTGMRVRIKSVYSPEARNAAVTEARALKLVDGEVQSKDEVFESTLFKQVVAVTVGWYVDGESTDTIYVAGEWVPCTPETVRAVYTDPRTAWVQRQVQSAYLTLDGFFGAPKAS